MTDIPSRTGRALVVVAHPDDAEIAVGGTIARLSALGFHVRGSVLSLPESGAGAAARRTAIEDAAALLGYELDWLEEGERRQVSDIGEARLVQQLDSLIAEYLPDLVFTHWDGDSHIDHVVTARAVSAAVRKSHCDVYQFRPGELRTPAFARFSPTAFVDISSVRDQKFSALKPFSEARPGFRPLDLDGIESVDRLHGAMAGCSYAEGFVVARQRGLSRMGYGS